MRVYPPVGKHAVNRSVVKKSEGLWLRGGADALEQKGNCVLGEFVGQFIVFRLSDICHEVQGQNSHQCYGDLLRISDQFVFFESRKDDVHHCQKENLASFGNMVRIGAHFGAVKSRKLEFAVERVRTGEFKDRWKVGQNR